MGARGVALGAPLALLALGAILHAASARAHSRSEGKSSFKLEESGRVAITVQLAEADLPELCNADFSVAERAREEEKLSRCLEQGFARWLRVAADDRPCPVAYQRWSTRERTVLLEAEALCPALPAELVVDWGLFAGAPLDHVSVGLFEEPHAKARVFLFSKRSSRFVLEVARPWWPLAVAGGAGVALVAIAGALVWRRRRAPPGGATASGPGRG